MKIDNNVPHFVCEDTNCRWHCNQLDYHVRGNPVENYDPTTYKLSSLISYLGQGRQKKVDGCCAQCKDLSNKKGEKK